MDDKDKNIKLDPEMERKLVTDDVQQMKDIPGILPELLGYLDTHMTTFEELKAALEEQKVLCQLILNYIELGRVMANKFREMNANRMARGG